MPGKRKLKSNESTAPQKRVCFIKNLQNLVETLFFELRHKENDENQSQLVVAGDLNALKPDV